MLYKVTISSYVIIYRQDLVRRQGNIRQTDASLILEPLSNNGRR